MGQYTKTEETYVWQLSEREKEIVKALKES